MLHDVAAASEAGLRALGFRVGARSGDTWELTLPNSRPATRTLRGDRGRITLSEARKRGDQAGGERALLVAPSASPGVLDAARLGRWDLLLWAGPTALINGVSYAAIGSGAPLDAPRRRDRLGEAAPLTQPAPLPPGLSGASGGATRGVASATASWADNENQRRNGNMLAGQAGVRPGASLARDGGHAASAGSETPTHTGGRPAWTRWAVARVLLLGGGSPVGQLADVLGVSRQAVGRALTQWGGLVTRDGAGSWRAVDPAELLTAWTSAYPGPGGRAEYWWHPLPPLGQARAAAKVAQAAGAWPLFTGAVAAQVHDPSIGARTTRLLLRTPIDLRAAGFMRSTADEASLVTLVPRDPTLWATSAPATVAGEPVIVVDRLTALHPA